MRKAEPPQNVGHWPAQYRELTRMVYTLRRQCPSLPLLATSEVHPRHPLPVKHLELIEAFASDGEEGTPTASNGAFEQRNVPPLSLIIKRWMRCLLVALYDTVAVICLKLRVGSLARRALRAPATVVMKTWTFGPRTSDSSDDFYYGKLPQMLHRRGLRCVLLYGDLSAGSESASAQTAVNSGRRFNYIPERVLLPVWAPLLLAWKQLRTSLNLRRFMQGVKDRKFSVLCEYACVSCLSPATTRSASYFYIAREAVKRGRSQVFVTLYEGQPWEKPAWHGARAANKECLIVGYQHTVLMPHSFSLTWPNSESWELAAPDIVLCLGEATRNLMEPGYKSCATRLIPFGSFRSRPAKCMQSRPKPARRTVLVIPEGFLREAKLLFDFAMRVAPLLDDYYFVFRSHPILPFARIRSELKCDPEEMSNVEISDRASIADDFLRSSVVLYRGSSAVLYAVLYGLKPIYLHDAQHHDVDPLYELRSWREIVSNASEMASVLRHYAAMSDAEANVQWQTARMYVDAYTTPVDDASIDRFLDAMGISGEKEVG